MAVRPGVSLGQSGGLGIASHEKVVGSILGTLDYSCCSQPDSAGNNSMWQNCLQKRELNLQEYAVVNVIVDEREGRTSAPTAR